MQVVSILTARQNSFIYCCHSFSVEGTSRVNLARVVQAAPPRCPLAFAAAKPAPTETWCSRPRPGWRNGSAAPPAAAALSRGASSIDGFCRVFSPTPTETDKIPFGGGNGQGKGKGVDGVRGQTGGESVLAGRGGVVVGSRPLFKAGLRDQRCAPH